MNPNPEKNFIMECHNNEIKAEYQIMSRGIEMLRFECPDPNCDKRFSHEIKSESELLDYHNAMRKYKNNVIHLNSKLWIVSGMV